MTQREATALRRFVQLGVGDLGEHASSERVAFGGESPALVVVEPRPFVAELL